MITLDAINICAGTKKQGPYAFRFVVLQMRMRCPLFGLQTCVFFFVFFFV